MSTQPKDYITPEQYLEIDRKAEFKSEYYQGEMFAMAGAGWIHNRLVSRWVAQFERQFTGGRCQGVPNDQRVQVSATKLYTYPDVVVVCGEPEFADERRETLLNPTVIVEVLSPSTEAYDRGRKFEHYRSISSLQYYVLVASDRMHIDWYIRQPNERWLLGSASQPEHVVALDAIGCNIKLSDVYEGLDLA